MWKKRSGQICTWFRPGLSQTGPKPRYRFATRVSSKGKYSRTATATDHAPRARDATRGTASTLACVAVKNMRTGLTKSNMPASQKATHSHAIRGQFGPNSGEFEGVREQFAFAGLLQSVLFAAPALHFACPELLFYNIKQ